ncbi:MAG: sialidase family protein [Candidatus Dormibacteria bacterium]
MASAFLVVVALSLVDTAAPASATTAPSLRPNVVVNPDALTTQFRVHRYPAAAVDPANPAHLVEVDTDQAGVDCTAHASFDGGYTWTASPIPLPEGWSICKQQGNNASLLPGQPAVAFEPDGTVIAVLRPTNSPSSNPGTAAFAVDASSDGGRSFAPLSFAFPTGSGAPDTSAAALAQYLAVDTTGGPYSGNVYVLSSPALGFSVPSVGVRLSVSTDGGHSFSAGMPVGALPLNSEIICCASLGIGPQGEVDVVAPIVPAQSTSSDCASAFQHFNSCYSLAVYRSTTGGSTWSAPQILYDGASSSATFGIGVDPSSGTVYAVIADPHPGNDGLWVASIADSATAQATATEIAHAPADADFAYPAGSATAGRFDFAYFLVRRGSAVIAKYDSNGKQTGTYDARQHPCTSYAGAYGNYPGFGDTCPTNVYFGDTSDGVNFPLKGGIQLNTATFDDLVGFEYGGDGNQVVLDGLAVVSTPGFARAFWTDSRNNTNQSDGNQDQYSACVAEEAAACPVPSGYSPGQPLTGIPDFTPPLNPATTSFATRTPPGRRVLRRDVYDPMPIFPPPIPGAPATQSPPLIRTVLAADRLVPLYISAMVAAALTLIVLLGFGLWRAYTWIVD